MSTTETARPSTAYPAALSQDDCPTESIPVGAPGAPGAPVPVRRSILRPAAAASAPTPAVQLERSPFADWRDAAPTEEMSAVSSAAAGPARPRVSTHHKPTSGREARRTAPAGTKGLRRQHPRLARHLRAALAGLLIAAALLTGLQLYAAAGISSARQAALAGQAAQRDAQATEQATEQSAPTPSAPSEQADAHPQADWLIEGTTTAAPSPLDLPRCTTSPDTPLPCLATISPSQTRAVVLEEDAPLTAVVRR